MKTRYALRTAALACKAMSGCAWRVYYHDGSSVNFIESPYPKTPISLAIFLHEVGHHAIGFNTYRQRCEEEYHAWRRLGDRTNESRLALSRMPECCARFRLSMQYAVGKAVRRGIKQLPHNLVEFLPQAA